MDMLDGRDGVIVQPNVGAPDVGFQLRERRGADDGRGDEWAAVDDSERKLCRVVPMGVGNRHIARRCGRLAGQVIADELLSNVAARAFGDLAAQIFAGEIAARQRRIGEQANILTQGKFGQSLFEGAVEEAIGILDRRHSGQVLLPRQAKIFRNVPRRFVRHAEMADLARADQVGESGERLFGTVSRP